MKLSDNKGNALLVVCCICALMIPVIISVVSLSVNGYEMAIRSLNSVRMQYLAEGGTEMMARSLAVAVANYNSEPSSADGVWNEISGQDASFLNTGYSIDYTCESMSGEYQTVDATGIVTLRRQYKLRSVVKDPDTGISVKLNQIVSRDKTYAFQHAVLYTEDLEILPGPDMTLSGKVHTNKNMYIDSDGNILTVDSDYLRAVGDIFKKRKNTGNELSGNVNIWNSDTLTFRRMREASDSDPMDSDNPLWVSGALDRWGGTVQSGEHGVTAVSAPYVQSIQPDGYYAGNAKVKVINGNLFKNGVQLVEGVDIPSGTVTTSTTFYDNREEKYCKHSTIDLRKLAGWEPGTDEFGNPIETQNYPNNMPDNGLLYATRTDADVDQIPAVKLINGNEIYSDIGLSIVSNVPVYIQGDYNVVNKTSASVICDAINLLSNNWIDANSSSNLNSRVADDTTINSAFISGIVPTVGGDYSGGLENLPRLHEKWSNKTLYLRGSFVVLWESQNADGQWEYGGDIYKAPIRNWDYDIDFNDSSKLPPFTPFAVTTSRVAWWKE